MSDPVELLTLELHRAGRALLQIVLMRVAAAVPGFTAWLVLWAGIVVASLSLGAPERLQFVDPP